MWRLNFNCLLNILFFWKPNFQFSCNKKLIPIWIGGSLFSMESFWKQNHPCLHNTYILWDLYWWHNMTHDEIWCIDTLSFWYTAKQNQNYGYYLQYLVLGKETLLLTITLFSLTCTHFHIGTRCPLSSKRY
jgi:hypothetical protein